MATVLITGPSADLQVALTQFLIDMDHDVLLAQDGREGLGKMAEDLPDLVMTELYMERMEGIEFLRRILYTWPSMPVVVLIGMSDPGAGTMRRVVEALGAARVLEKPICPKQLRSTINTMLGELPRCEPE